MSQTVTRAYRQALESCRLLYEALLAIQLELVGIRISLG